MSGQLRARIRIELDGDVLADETVYRHLSDPTPWSLLFADGVDATRAAQAEFARRHPYDVTVSADDSDPSLLAHRPEEGNA